ncbi:pseudouridylate synthase 7 homolog [Ostrinia nubilalis]|uniref:pseudouridylate synthase 7 homolog n=1 Tax=Ostrinia nubilalis TaxID=29057 RepID=UPI003082471D
MNTEKSGVWIRGDRRGRGGHNNRGFARGGNRGPWRGGKNFRGLGYRDDRNFSHGNWTTNASQQWNKPRRETPGKRLAEDEIGVTKYISDHAGFNGIIKMRYSDFQVSEINEKGEIAKLTDLTPPEPPEDEAVDEDEDLLLSKYNLEILPLETWDSINKLVLTKDTDESIEVDATNMSKEQRTKIHDAVKKAFGESIVGSTINIEDKKLLRFTRYRKGVRIDNRIKWVWPGEYVHFIVYKENCDTMDAASRIAEKLRLNIKPSMVGYAGSKDRRAVTSQWFSLRKVAPRRVAAACQALRDVCVGNYSFSAHNLRLGMLKGNKFRIALRNVTATDDVVDNACRLLQENGFINYYGLQRFGTRVDTPTYEIGRKLLQGNFREAINSLLEEREGMLQPALQRYHEAGPIAALQALPRGMSGSAHVETRLIRALAKAPNDLVGALSKVLPRGMSGSEHVETRLIRALAKAPNDLVGALSKVMTTLPPATQCSLLCNHEAGPMAHRFTPRVQALPRGMSSGSAHVETRLIRALAKAPNDLSLIHETKLQQQQNPELRSYRAGSIAALQALPRGMSGSAHVETRPGQGAQRLGGSAVQGSVYFETRLIRALAKAPNDLVGALSKLARNTRLLYLHSYQSLVWNRAVSERIARLGLRPAEGDLVPAGSETHIVTEEMNDGEFEDEDNNENESDADTNDASEAPADNDNDSSDKRDKDKNNDEKPKVPVKVLTKEEAESGQYTIFDVIMPLPGYNIDYPPNMKDFYEEEMAKDNLKLDLRHKVKCYSMSGAYRHVAVRPFDVSWRSVRYSQPYADLLRSDRDQLTGRELTGIIEGTQPPTMGSEHGLTTRKAERHGFGSQTADMAGWAARAAIRDTNTGYNSTQRALLAALRRLLRSDRDQLTGRDLTGIIEGLALRRLLRSDRDQLTGRELTGIIEGNNHHHHHTILLMKLSIHFFKYLHEVKLLYVVLIIILWPYDDLLRSDRDELTGRELTGIIEDGKYKALLLEMSLPASCYATMALRELLKVDTSCDYQAMQNNYHRRKKSKDKTGEAGDENSENNSDANDSLNMSGENSEVSRQENAEVTGDVMPEASGDESLKRKMDDYVDVALKKVKTEIE